MKAESSAVGAVIADLEAVSVQRASARRHQPSVAATAKAATGSGSSSWIGCCLHCDIGALDGLAGDRDRLLRPPRSNRSMAASGTAPLLLGYTLPGSRRTAVSLGSS
jgi:hypothetical protein